MLLFIMRYEIYHLEAVFLSEEFKRYQDNNDNNNNIKTVLLVHIFPLRSFAEQRYEVRLCFLSINQVTD